MSGKLRAQLEIGDPNGVNSYFKFLAVEHPKSFAIVLARIMPLHITSNNAGQKYATEEQMRARLREAGLPEHLITFMKPIDSRTLDPDEVPASPYDDPEDETDEEGLIDVTPKREAAE